MNDQIYFVKTCEQGGVVVAPCLTDRELSILQMVGNGMTYKGIAQELNLSKNTVRVHMTNARQKLGCVSTAQATAIAAKMGLISVDNAIDSG